MTEFIHAVVAITALAVVLVVPPFIVARRFGLCGGGWMTILSALAMGCVSQGLLGLLWNRLVMARPGVEVVLYYGLWIGASLWTVRRFPVRRQEIPLGRGEGWGLTLTLLLAALVRLLHPLAHSALGQSDAYSHLQFIRQVVENGAIGNQIYPPAYSWIMALPSISFHLDPYWLARYGGAFWGIALILALFALGRSGGRPWAGLFAAALVAVCPAWMPLMKTGVGAFANQSGLFFLPLVLLSFMRVDRPRAFWFLMALSAILVSAVPMMWISLMPVLLVDRLLAFSTREPHRWRMALFAALAFVPSLALLGWQSARMQGLHREVTVAIVTGEESHSAPIAGAEEVRPPSAVEQLLQNYLSFKRWGYGDPRMNGMGIGLGLAFLGTLMVGLRRKDPALRLLGGWGLITSVQAGTGCLQFTGYQREGWALLMATAWLGGVAGSAAMEIKTGRNLWRSFALGFFAVSVGWTWWHPPAHAAAFSTAEDEIIDVVRSAAQGVQGNSAEWPLTIVARPFTGFHGNQGDLIAATAGHSARVSTVAVNSDTRWSDVERPGRQYLFLMDRVPFGAEWTPGFFARVQPDQVNRYLDAHHQLFQMNQKVEEWVDQFPADQWKKERLSTSPVLESILVQPISK